MQRAYASTAERLGHPLSGAAVAALAAVVATAAWWATPVVGVAAAAVAWCAVGTSDRYPGRVLAVLLVGGVLGGLRGADAWAGLAPRHTGTYQGWATLVDDPQPYRGSTRVILELDGERFEMWARGRALRLRVSDWRGGESVHVRGTRSALDPERRQRVAWQHVVGEFDYEWASDRAPGGPLARASNRVRQTIERGAAAGFDAPEQAALFRGLVVGDDRDQPAAMVDRFRASGLSHLTAVSGQNVSFVLAAAGPLLRGLGPRARWAATLALIGWFVTLTRCEPSIVRAGAMAALSATGFLLGRARSPGRLLGLAVAGLVLVDPLLVRSVGFQLSVGATAGVAVLGPVLARRLGALGPLAVPAGVTLGAQLGVAVPQLLVFGQLPVVSIPANLLAVPVAGAVMLYGLPAALVAGAVPATAPAVLFPCRLGVRWVDLVAALAAELEPAGAGRWIGWGVVALAVAWVVSLRSGQGAPTPTDAPGTQR